MGCNPILGPEEYRVERAIVRAKRLDLDLLFAFLYLFAQTWLKFLPSNTTHWSGLLRSCLMALLLLLAGGLCHGHALGRLCTLVRVSALCPALQAAGILSRLAPALG